MTRPPIRAGAWAGVGVWLVLSSVAAADMISITPVKDNTLIEDLEGDVSNGGEDGIFVGRVGTTGLSRIRRGLLEFDVSAIPSGSTINTVQLRLRLERGTSLSGTRTVTVHKLLGDWGEGTASDPIGGGGGGGPAGIGDATWLHQFFNADPWTNPGGDFVPAASASLGVTTTAGFKTFVSTPLLVADVQSWVNDSTTNFGFLLRGDESVQRTARKFYSREAVLASNWPTLIVDFTPPARIPGDVDNDDDVDRDDVLLMLQNWNKVGGATADHGEFSGDANVGVGDLGILQSHFSGPGPTPSAPQFSAPEPATWAIAAAALGIATWKRIKRRAKAA